MPHANVAAAMRADPATHSAIEFDGVSIRVANKESVRANHWTIFAIVDLPVRPMMFLLAPTLCLPQPALPACMLEHPVEAKPERR